MVFFVLHWESTSTRGFHIVLLCVCESHHRHLKNIDTFSIDAYSAVSELKKKY